MMKEAHTGGAHLWHQDYGYWYQNECLTPDMGSIFMPIDKCTRQNSCLQFEHICVEMEPGDGLFFHSNLLHTSDQNKSSMRRWVFISSFNQARNKSEKKCHHADYHPLQILPNQALMQCSQMDSSMPKDFMDPKMDKSASSLKRLEEK